MFSVGLIKARNTHTISLCNFQFLSDEQLLIEAKAAIYSFINFPALDVIYVYIPNEYHIHINNLHADDYNKKYIYLCVLELRQM